MSGKQPTVVLLHGGGSSSAFWDLLRPALDQPSIAVDLPGRAGIPADPMTVTIDDGVACVVDQINAADIDEFVLVAHSSGCFYAPGIAERVGPRLRHIVVFPPCIPTVGGTGLEAMKPSYARRSQENIDRARATGVPFTTAGPPDDPEVLRHAYGVALTDTQVAFVAAPERNPKDSVNIYYQPVDWRVAAGIPITALRLLRDPITPLALQDEMIGRLPDPDMVRVVDIDTGHIPAVTDVEVLAALINALAAEPDDR